MDEKRTDTNNGHTVCPSCGADVPPRRRYCPSCGGVVRDFERGVKRTGGVDISDDTVRKARAAERAEQKEKAAERAPQKPEAAEKPEAPQKPEAAEKPAAPQAEAKKEPPAKKAQAAKKTAKPTEAKDGQKGGPAPEGKPDIISEGPAPGQKDEPEARAAGADAAEPPEAIDVPVTPDVLAPEAPVAPEGAQSGARGGEQAPSVIPFAGRREPKYGDPDYDPFGFDEPKPLSCPSCGGKVLPHEKFCMRCGKPLVKRCWYCGSFGALADKFCYRCGSALERGAVGKHGDRDGHTSEEVARKRRVSDILEAAAFALVAFLGLIFLATPFISVYDYSPSGFAMIGALFGGDSVLFSAGALSNEVRSAGWTCFAYLLMALPAMVGFFIRIFGDDKRLRPMSALYSVIPAAVISVVMIVYSAICASQIGERGGEVSYMGAIGVLCSAFAALFVSISAYVVRAGAYPRVKPRLTKPRLAYLITLLAAGVVAVSTVMLPMRATYAATRTVAPGDSGRAQLKIEEQYKNYYLGTTIFLLKDLTKGETYAFEIEFSTRISADSLDGALLLFYAGNIEGKTSAEILELRCLAYNESRGVSTARLTFRNDYDLDLAIVVDVASTARISLEFGYTFKRL